MRGSTLLKISNRIPLLIGLGATVFLCVVQRPSSLLTFGFIALAGILTLPSPKGYPTSLIWDSRAV
ncbi:hypothetical protein [Prochlorococcus sp. MIT 1341]|uniref:hypothetical protein n=1 Tax=Prochlorococcus sp. MIT 1341 TaxID=3096221 RepID=UPI002A75CCF5|nr:hypothetical protein [Prochlorococcus sp. MIT 1341]